MAREVQVIYSDDLDGSTGDIETVQFYYDGEMLEVDLGPANAQKLRDAMRPFATVARKASVQPAKPKTKPAKSKGLDDEAKRENAAIREWAKENDVQCPERGRIPQSVRDLYALDQAA